MQLIFIYGPPASGKLTIAREIASTTGWAVFHNHLIVDAVSAVFPFGSPAFVSLRELFWLRVMREAAREGRSLLFTFAPEPTVSPDFPQRVQQVINDAGGDIVFVRLTISAEEQERRLDAESRKAFDKMRSIELLRSLRDDFARCELKMPRPDMTVDTSSGTACECAVEILKRIPFPTNR